MKVIVISFVFLLSCTKNVEQIDYEKINDGRYTIKEVDGKKLVYIDKNDLVPPMPDEDENNETVLGVDVDEDGVRDDLEIFINQSVEDRRARKAMKIYVRLEGLAKINADKNEKEALFYMKKDTLAISCYVHILMNKDVEAYHIFEDEFDRLRNNTSERKRLRHKLDRIASGNMFTSSFTACDDIGVKDE